MHVVYGAATMGAGRRGRRANKSGYTVGAFLRWLQHIKSCQYFAEQGQGKGRHFLYSFMMETSITDWAVVRLEVVFKAPEDKRSDKEILDARGTSWMYKFRTVHPFGFNNHFEGRSRSVVTRNSRNVRSRINKARRGLNFTYKLAFNAEFFDMVRPERSKRRFISHDLESAALALRPYAWGGAKYAEMNDHLEDMRLDKIKALLWYIKELPDGKLQRSLLIVGVMLHSFLSTRLGVVDSKERIARHVLKLPYLGKRMKEVEVHKRLDHLF